MAKNQPKEKFRIGNIEVAVWENVQKDSPSLSISIQKSYRDQNGDFKTTNCYFKNEIEVLVSLIKQAQKYFE
jgi:hypothetical protein